MNAAKLGPDSKSRLWIRVRKRPKTNFAKGQRFASFRRCSPTCPGAILGPIYCNNIPHIPDARSFFLFPHAENICGRFADRWDGRLARQC